MARRHVLIGTGPAAMSAAQAIRSQDTHAEIVVVGAEPHGYYSRPGLAYYLAKEVPESGLFPFTPRDIARLRITLINGRALRVDTTAHLVTLAGGRSLPYDRLLIATGSSAIPVHTLGTELDGVVKLDDMDDARDLIQRSRHAKAAVVVGGGITALEIVEGLKARKVHVHYLMRKDRYWSNVLSGSESRIVEEGLRAQGVEIHYFTELASIIGEEGHVVAAVTDKGVRIPCEMVAVAIGVLPQKDLAQAAGITCGRGILVDEHLRSSDPDVYAAGDVAEVLDPQSGQRILEVLWSSAVAKGRIAGLNMATEPTRSYDKGAAPLNVTRLAGFKITIIGTVGNGDDSDLEGLARGDSQTWRDLGDAMMVESQSGDTHTRLALAGGTIAGAIVMGDQALSFPLQELVEARADVRAIVPSLRSASAPVAQLVHGYWESWVASHA